MVLIMDTFIKNMDQARETSWFGGWITIIIINTCQGERDNTKHNVIISWRLTKFCTNKSKFTISS